jgi:hypothetical protein
VKDNRLRWLVNSFFIKMVVKPLPYYSKFKKTIKTGVLKVGFESCEEYKNRYFCFN